MYGVYTYIHHTNQPNVGVYTIHGSYGIYKSLYFSIGFSPMFDLHPAGEKTENVMSILFQAGWEKPQQVA